MSDSATPVDHGNGLWTITHPFSMLGAIQLGLRTTIVRLEGGKLLLHSPGPLTAAHQEAIRALGDVGHIVAPNLFHHLFLNDAVAAFPGAEVHVPEGLREKKKDLPPHSVLTAAGHADWSGSLGLLEIPGSGQLGEWLFHHPPSRTLLIVDLAFNVQRGTLPTRVFLRLNNAWQRFGPSRLARSFMSDHAAVKSGVDKALEWDFDRAIVCHGDIVETGAKAKLRAAFDGFP